MSEKLVFIIETIHNRITQPVKELLDFGESLLSGGKAERWLVISGQDVSEPADQLSAETCLPVLAIEHEGLALPNPSLLQTILPAVLGRFSPSYILMNHTMRSCQLAAALAIQLDAACITGVESHEIRDGNPVFTRMMFNGKMTAQTACMGKQAVLTIIPGAGTGTFVPERKENCRPPEINKADTAQSGFFPRQIVEETAGDNRLEEADVIVSAGMGVGREENMAIIRETAALFKNPAIAGSRIVCDHGWLPYACQVGETGKQVAPKLYIACGISGTMQHTAGMKRSQCIVAINTDPNAPIFSIADYGVVEDLQTFLPILAERFRDRKN